MGKKMFFVFVVAGLILGTTVHLVYMHCGELFSSILICIGLFFLYRLWRYKSCRFSGLLNYNRIWLYSSALLYVWFMGFSFYYAALRNTIDDVSMFELLARSGTRSALMFVSGVDSNIIADVHNLMKQPSSTGLAACLAVTAAVAVAFTFVFLITVFFSRLKSYIYLFYQSFWGKYDRLYIFFGFNKQNIAIAKDINQKHSNELQHLSHKLVFVGKQLSAIDNETSGWASILSTFTHRAETFRNARKLHAGFAVMNDSFTSEMMEEQLKSDDDVLCKLGLNSIKRLISKMGRGTEVHIFCLADNEYRLENIIATIVLQRDKTLQTYALKDDTKAKIHCLARYNSINRVMEDIDRTSRVEINIVDPSHLSIECLKRELIHQPVSFVDIDSKNNPGAVSSPFTSLVVGFSETGKDAVRFLYEFGAFVDANSTEAKTIRSPFLCHVVDNRMDTLKGPFVNAAPAVFENINENTGQPLIELHNMEYNSGDFFNGLLPKLAPQLNYVIIAIGDDEAGMTLAVRILKYMMRTERFQNHQFHHFRIFVRSYEPELYSHLKRIADHYNRGEERIHVFGKLEELFSYSLIVEDEFEEEGKKYYEAYRDLSNKKDKPDTTTWEQRRENILKKKSTLLEQLQEIRRKESQDKANALHAATKLCIGEAVLGSNGVEELAKKVLTVLNGKVSSNSIRINAGDSNKSKIVYPALSGQSVEQKLMSNLAKTEHLRWNAAHEMMGYTENTTEHTCNETTMQHNCLKPWEKLRKESKDSGYDYEEYDYCVVDTMLKQKFFGNNKQEKT